MKIQFPLNGPYVSDEFDICAARLAQLNESRWSVWVKLGEKEPNENKSINWQQKIAEKMTHQLDFSLINWFATFKVHKVQNSPR